MYVERGLASGEAYHLLLLSSISTYNNCYVSVKAKYVYWEYSSIFYAIHACLPTPDLSHSESTSGRLELVAIIIAAQMLADNLLFLPPTLS